MAEPPPEPIDHRLLTPQALEGVLEDVVTRGEPDETDVALRCRQLAQALDRGEALLFWDPRESTVYVRSARKLF